MSLSLGLDLGTTKTAAVAVDVDGRVVRQVSRVHRADLTSADPRIAEQSPQRHLETALSVLRELADDLPGVPRCLGVTGQMHGVMVTDRQRQPVTPLITWQDRRLLHSRLGTLTRYDELMAPMTDESLEPTGCRLVPGFGGLTLSELAATRQLPVSAAHAVFLADWVASCLVVAPPVTDRSNAGSWGVFNFRSDTWDDRLINALGIPRDLFPEIRASGSCIGYLVPEMAAETGLPSGLPVGCALGDNPAAIIGSTWGHAEFLQINLGTGGQIAWPLASFERLPGLETRYLPNARFMAVGAGVSGGSSYAWLAQTVKNWLGEFGHDHSLDEIFTRLNQAAAAADEHHGNLICVPTFRGTRRNPELRGSIHHIDPSNMSLGNLARATLVGIIDGLEQFLAAPGAPDPRALPLRLGTGNALRKNPLLARIAEARFGSPLLTTQQEEEAAFGAALLTGIELDIWPRPPQIQLRPLVTDQASPPRN